MKDLVFVRHLVYHRGEEDWYRELSQICYSAREKNTARACRACSRACSWQLAVKTRKFIGWFTWENQSTLFNLGKILLFSILCPLKFT